VIVVRSYFAHPLDGDVPSFNGGTDFVPSPTFAAASPLGAEFDSAIRSDFPRSASAFAATLADAFQQWGIADLRKRRKARRSGAFVKGSGG